MIYKYQNKALNNKIEILTNDVLIGVIQFNNWKSNVQIEINRKRYIIKKKGFWRRDFDVFDTENQEIVAEIIFETWKSKVKINLSNSDSYFFNHQDFWQKNWIIFGNNLDKIEFLKTKSFWNHEGEIQSNISESAKSELLITIGVFLIFHKKRQAATAAASS